MEKQFNQKHGAKQRSFSEKDTVYARVYIGNNKFKWELGPLIESVGNVMYNVLLNNGKLIRTHANKLQKDHGNTPAI